MAWPGGSGGDLGKDWTGVKTAVSGSSVLIRMQSQGLLLMPESQKFVEAKITGSTEYHLLSLGTELSTLHTLPHWYYCYLLSSHFYR